MGTVESRSTDTPPSIDSDVKSPTHDVRSPGTSAIPSETSGNQCDLHFGLNNYGNTCYCNSVLQALFHCRPFKSAILERARLLPAASSAPPRNPFSSALSSLSNLVSGADDGDAQYKTLLDALTALFVHIARLQERSEKQTDQKTSTAKDGGDASHERALSRSVGPRSFVSTLRRENELFRSLNQQDAQEFLIYLLNDVAEALEREARDSGVSAENAKRTAVHDIFEGMLTNEIKCLHCETLTTREEPFLDLAVDISENVSVSGCLKNFGRTEMLHRANKFQCSACGALQEAHKQFRLQRCPRVLVLQLKRFKYVEQLGRFTKLSHRIPYPKRLRLPCATGEQLYALFAVVLHLGASPNSGHYLTIVRGEGGEWRVHDDDDVFTIHEHKLAATFGSIGRDDGHSVSASQTSYLLFYERLEDIALESDDSDHSDGDGERTHA